MIGKYDINSAYRRGTVLGLLIYFLMAVVKGIAILSFRLTFGSSFFPFTLCLLIEISNGLANELLRRKTRYP